jgi:hypothetical protein
MYIDSALKAPGAPGTTTHHIGSRRTITVPKLVTLPDGRSAVLRRDSVWTDRRGALRIVAYPSEGDRRGVALEVSTPGVVDVGGTP